MNPVLYWPYDEISLSINEGHTHATIHAPWLEAAVSLNESNKSKIEILEGKFRTQTLLPEDLELINWLFAEFRNLPFCYILPTPKTALSQDRHHLQDESLLAVSLDSFLEKSCAKVLNSEPSFSGTTSVSQTLNLARDAWDWDVQAAMQFAAIGDKIHPESLLSVSRRYHLLDLMADKHAGQIFAKVSKLQAGEFKLAAAIMVRQNHYVTQKCQAALLPALEIAASARDLVESFIKEENGHDRILGVALQSVTNTDDFDAMPVSRQTQLLMHLLEFSARKNFLAFAMVIDMFERSTFEKTDPLAQLLAQGGFAKAAKQVNRHKEINDAGDHENIALSFLSFMAPCDSQYALEALRIAEAVNLLAGSILASAFDLFEKNRHKL